MFKNTNISNRNERGSPNEQRTERLTEDEIEAVALRAGELVIEAIYIEVGKVVIRALILIGGALGAALPLGINYFQKLMGQ